ncbi:MAG: VOC family protein [Rhodanobacter sp.]
MNLTTVEAKAFVPATDFERSKQFYLTIGFDIPWSDDGLAYVRHGACSFLLQASGEPEFVAHFQMHLLVENADDWRAHVVSSEEGGAAEVGPLTDQPWGMRDFTLVDPSGVLWRVAQNILPGNVE